MSISQHEAVSLLRTTIFRPGWRVSARPEGGDQVLVSFEIETVDSSFVTRGGEYRVPLTERALILVRTRDYATPEALLFRVLQFVRELQDHEDREFLRTWDPAAERWTAPFHSHAPEAAQAWEHLSALPQPALTRVGTSGDAPWANAACDSDYVCWAGNDSKPVSRARVVSAGCDSADDRGDCWESGSGRAMHAAGCDEGILDEDCWENGKRALVSTAAPCNEQVDDDEGPQRALALAHAAAHPVAVAGCNECDGGCASWG